MTGQGAAVRAEEERRVGREGVGTGAEVEEEVANSGSVRDADEDTAAVGVGLGDAEVWNYALVLGFPDFGKEGSLLSFIVGVEPYLGGTDGFDVVDGQGNARRSDPDTGLHIEGFYRYQLTDNLSITPGVVWLTAPGHDDDNSDIVVGTIRTTFQF